MEAHCVARLTPVVSCRSLEEGATHTLRMSQRRACTLLLLCLPPPPWGDAVPAVRKDVHVYATKPGPLHRLPFQSSLPFGSQTGNWVRPGAAEGSLASTCSSNSHRLSFS